MAGWAGILDTQLFLLGSAAGVAIDLGEFHAAAQALDAATETGAPAGMVHDALVLTRALFDACRGEAEAAVTALSALEAERRPL